MLIVFRVVNRRGLPDPLLGKCEKETVQRVEGGLPEALRHERFTSLDALWAPRYGPTSLSEWRTSARSIAVPIGSSLQVETQLTFV